MFGSHDMISDAFYNAKTQTVMGSANDAGNRVFASAVTDWALKRNGDLRFGTVKHNKVSVTTVGPRFNGPRFTGTSIYREDKFPPI